jgi:hypothetical protein
MTVALILVVDPMFFRPFCSHIYSIIRLSLNFLHYNSIQPRNASKNSYCNIGASAAKPFAIILCIVLLSIVARGLAAEAPICTKYFAICNFVLMLDGLGVVFVPPPPDKFCEPERPAHNFYIIIRAY